MKKFLEAIEEHPDVVIGIGLFIYIIIELIVIKVR